MGNLRQHRRTASSASLQQTLLRRVQRYERKFDQDTWRFVVLSWVGCIGMPAYYLIWTYWFPQHYDSLPLRLVGAALCLPAPWAARLLTGRARGAYLFVASPTCCRSSSCSCT